jgi:hypothetical protein
VEPARLPALLKDSLTAPVLGGLLRATLELLLPTDAPAALAMLRALTAVPRFDTATLLVSGRDKAALAAVWDAAAGGAPADAAEALAALRPKFRCCAR